MYATIAQTRNNMKHNENVVFAFFKAFGIPRPMVEHKFHPHRKWKFDYCWVLFYCNLPVVRVALEVEGGVWRGGRHTSGAGFMKDMEKYNAAALLGWRVLRCTPEDLLKTKTAEMIKEALGLE